jgi:hypothetical protein
MSEEQGLWNEVKELDTGEKIFLPVMFTVFGAIGAALVMGSGLASLAMFAVFWVSFNG